MKKLITSLATIALISGSVANATAMKQMQHNQTILNSNKSTKASPNSPKKQSASEDAEDIANKLFGKTIKIDAYFWVGKDVSNYQSQFNAAIVTQGVLTKAETKYVTWGHLTVTKVGIFAQGGHFTVKKADATATGNVTVNAANIDSAQDIADKIHQATKAQDINILWMWWGGKDIYDYQAQFSAIVIRRGIINLAESHLIHWGHCWIYGGLDYEYAVPFTVSKDGATAINDAMVYTID